MYRRDSEKDWVGSIVMAGLGAGVITSFAVSQGQHPLIALGITLFAIGATLVLDHYL